MSYDLKRDSGQESYSSIRYANQASGGFGSRAPNLDYFPRSSGIGDYGGNPENKIGMRLDL